MIISLLASFLLGSLLNQVIQHVYVYPQFKSQGTTTMVLIQYFLGDMDPDVLYYTKQVSILIFLVFVLNTSLYMIYYYLLVSYNQKFRELKWEQKIYVIKNFTKATLLCYLTYFSTKIIYDVLVLKHWDNDDMTLAGLIYVSTDVSGLLFVPNLPTTTKIHHIMVSAIGFFTIIQDFRQPGIQGSFVGLAYFSVIPYLVNFLLGLRHLGFPVLKKQIAKLAGAIYALCIVANIIYQHVYTIYFSQAYYLTMGLYLLGYYLAILRDDFKLLQYLYYAGTRTTPIKLETIPKNAEEEK